MRRLHSSFYRRLANVMPRLVDSKTGIIRHLAELPIAAGAPAIFHFHSLASDTSAFTAHNNFFIGGGASRDRGSALAKAVGEAVERYCCAVFWPDDMPVVSAREAPFACAPPASFALFHPEQYADPILPFVPFDDDTLTRWIAGRALATGAEVHVPASRVFVPYDFDPASAEGPIGQPISTGLALHCSYEEAAISGLCEVIERDVFCLTWLANIAPPQIRPASLPPDLRDLHAQFTRTGAEVTLFDVTLDHAVPSILSVYRHPAPDSPALALAAATAPTAYEAALKSLEELDHTRHWAAILNRTSPPLPEGPASERVHGQSTHLRYWCDHARVGEADFLFRSDVRVDFDTLRSLKARTPAETLGLLVDAIGAIGGTAYAVDVTTPDVRPLGLVAVRTIVPELHPMFSGHLIRALGGKRLWTVPQALGYPALTGIDDTNPAPHPYP